MTDNTKLEPWQWQNLTEFTAEGREVFKRCTCGRNIGWNGHPYYWCKTS